MKYHIYIISELLLALKKNCSDHFKALYKLMLMTNFDVNPTSFVGKVINSYVLNH